MLELRSSKITLFTSQLFLLLSDQELVLDLALHLARNRCQQEIEWLETDLTRLYIFPVRAAKMQKDQGCEG